MNVVLFAFASTPKKIGLPGLMFALQNFFSTPISEMDEELTKKLQEFLKQHAEVYPEGLVTGYYGPLTEKAVKKFQEKYSIQSTGFVGPITRAKINQLLTLR